jgi:hypothetical protein
LAFTSVVRFLGVMGVVGPFTRVILIILLLMALIHLNNNIRPCI